MKKLSLIIALVLLSTSISFAADFPSKPITHIVPAKAGGGFDRSSRVQAVGWEKILGQPITFDYSPGASGAIGFGKMMARPSDGYTTIMTTIAMYAMNVNTGVAKAGWDKVGFVGNLITDPNVLLVHNDSPYKTIEEFIKAGKTAKKPLTISTSHPKAVSTLAAKILIELTGINAKVVPFDGGSKARNALAGKQVDACIGPYFSASSKKEFIKALASFTNKKVYSGLWDIPTLTEATGKNFPNLVEPFAFMIKRDVMQKSPENYNKLVTTFKEAVSLPSTLEFAEQQGMAPFIDYWTPEECDAYVQEFQSVWEEYKHLM
ncbi:Tripartite-type tricarboxylate transporter, receptor component TctC [Desulfuromusa kysingii]|uniref:Tripartite-type tricarboxylate transporter, receptor component TctC n=1 Tax=Desulfuromusa kysingii TaxID=37625 RepID=A0A1H3W7Q8_9BACT|nr:tripartite tricarboxylate transporter substrate binding protein [Desulfuromusa kysingii]SDZ83169.1 Tripartite-type tricarboxylate transporter, receptor component TctC [Desulfuromusa kysingii]